MEIKRFSDGSLLEYDRGSFDDWCVYYTDSSGVRRPPLDTEYFGFICILANEFTIDKVYCDYVKVYNWTGKEINPDVLNNITAISASYGDKSLQVDVVFSILYMAMIAEERKAFTELGKRIKCLGIHKLLKEGISVNESANFMRGMGWRDIDKLCRERGF